MVIIVGLAGRGGEGVAGAGVGGVAVRVAGADRGQGGVIVSADNAAETGVEEGLCVIPVRSLEEAASFLEDRIQTAPLRIEMKEIFARHYADEVDFADVKGPGVGEAGDGDCLGRQS